MVQLGYKIVQLGYEIVDCTSRGDTALLFSLSYACLDVWPNAKLADVPQKLDVPFQVHALLTVELNEDRLLSVFGGLTGKTHVGGSMAKDCHRVALADHTVGACHIL